jgi:hypothetical protein
MWYPFGEAMKKRYFLLALVFPLALAWDLLYLGITALYDVATWIDKRGEKVLDYIQSL